MYIERRTDQNRDKYYYNTAENHHSTGHLVQGNKHLTAERLSYIYFANPKFKRVIQLLVFHRNKKITAYCRIHHFFRIKKCSFYSITKICSSIESPGWIYKLHCLQKLY